MSLYFFQGVQIGLGLAVLVGPIIVLLIQLSLEEGTLSSVFAGLGIWCSDLLYILAAHFGLGKLRALIDHPSFEEIVGTIGGIVLIIVGISMYLRKPLEIERKLGRKRKARQRKPAIPHSVGKDRGEGKNLIEPQRHRANYGLSFVKGFGINTFNPFPIFFWSAVSVGIVYEEHLSSNETLSLYAGIIITIIATDALKIGAARYLRRWMTPKHTQLVQRIGAVALILFGLVLWLRVWL